jgi:signal transduction histidine kinase
MAVISVIDRGPGIPEEELSRLLKPFFRIRNRAPGGEPGSGLGLAIVKRIVQAHGGAVCVRSMAGEGSTFSFSLPMALRG